MSLKHLHESLNDGRAHSDPSLSAAVLQEIREMPQPCPKVSKNKVQGVGANIGDGANFNGSVVVSCQNAYEQPNKRWEKKKPTLCNAGGNCIMCLPRTRQGGTELIIIS